MNRRSKDYRRTGPGGRVWLRKLGHVPRLSEVNAAHLVSIQHPAELFPLMRTSPNYLVCGYDENLRKRADFTPSYVIGWGPRGGNRWQLSTYILGYSPTFQLDRAWLVTLRWYVSGFERLHPLQQLAIAGLGS